MGTPSHSHGIREPDTESPGRPVAWGFLLCPWAAPGSPWGLTCTQAPYLTPGKHSA